MIMNIMFSVVGLVAGYIIYDMRLRKHKGLQKLVSAIQKKRPVVFLETKTATYIKPIIKTFHNLAITDDFEIVIMPPSSIKLCPNLGIQIGHGDLYRSILVPTELIKFRDMLVSELDWNETQVAEFFEKVMNIPRAKLKEELEKEPIEFGAKSENKKQTQYNIYTLMPSTVTDFIYTGLNRVSIFDMQKNLIDQRELEKLGRKDWVSIAIGIFVILLGIGFMIKFVAPAVLPYLAASGATTPTATIPPARIG